jgi:tRNA(Phe) wybutosine-synthesizing methylase Tyw3
MTNHLEQNNLETLPQSIKFFDNTLREYSNSRDEGKLDAWDGIIHILNRLNEEKDAFTLSQKDSIGRMLTEFVDGTFGIEQVPHMSFSRYVTLQHGIINQNHKGDITKQEREIVEQWVTKF